MEQASERARRLSRFEWGCLGVVLLAFLFRAYYVVHPHAIWDTAWFLTLARSFGEHGAFLLPWFDRPAYSGYWPPLFPIYSAAFVKLLGPSYSTMVVAATFASALLSVGVLLMTWDLYGRTRAFAAMALVAASPPFLVTDTQGMSESLLALMVALTVWAFLKSLKRPLWLPPAGAFAVLAYLGKASLGLPLVAGGLVALGAWRVATRGWRGVLRSRPDLLAAGAALALLLAFALTRTDRLGGVGLGLIAPLLVIGDRWPLWSLVFLFKVAFAAGFLGFIAFPLTLHVPRAWRARKDEATSALWLATLLPLVAGAVFMATFHLTEERPLVEFDNIRYLSPALVPFLWLLLPHWPAEAGAAPAGRVQGVELRRRHERVFWTAAGLMALLLFLNPLPATPTLPRFYALLALSLVPLAFAWGARATHVETVPRRLAGGEVEHRYVRAKAPPVRWAVVASVGLASLLLGYYVSGWFIAMGLGLAVALAAASPRAQVVAMALMVMASTIPTFYTPTPWEEAVAEAARAAGPGGVVGVMGHPVYVAGVAPEGATLRQVENEEHVVDALLVVHMPGAPEPGTPEIGRYRLERSWNATFLPSPALKLRLALEGAFLGREYRFTEQPQASLYLPG